jgi:hypothetical protein
MSLIQVYDIFVWASIVFLMDFDMCLIRELFEILRWIEEDIITDGREQVRWTRQFHMNFNKFTKVEELGFLQFINLIPE